MDRTGGVTLAGVLVGLVAGFPAGVLYAVARRAWSDVGVTKSAVPNLQRSAWGFTGQAIFLGFLLAVVVAYALGADATP